MRPRALPLPLALALALAGCPSQDPSTSDVLPDGLVVAGDSAAFLPLAARAGAMGDAPLAVAARGLAEAVARCPSSFVAVSPDGGLEGLTRGVTCGAQGRVSPGGFVVAWPRADDGRVELEVTADAAGSFRFASRVPAAASGVLRLFRASKERAAVSRLPREGALAHAAIDVDDGLPLPEVLPPATRAFISTVTDGSWELAVYPPAPGAAMLQPAFSFGLSIPEVAERGLRRAVDESFVELGVRATELRIGTQSVVCVPELRVLPGLAPCAAVVDERLVLTWNQEVLERVLATGPPVRAESSFFVDFDRIAAVDQGLASSLNLAPLARVPWSVLHARAHDGTLEGCVSVRPDAECEQHSP